MGESRGQKPQILCRPKSWCPGTRLVVLCSFLESPGRRGEASLAVTIKGKLGLLPLSKMLPIHLPLCFAKARGQQLSLPGERRKRKGWPSTHQCIFPGQEQKSTPLRPSLPAPSPGCSLPTSSAREDGEGSRVTVTVRSFTESRDAGWCELHGSPRT